MESNLKNTGIAKNYQPDRGGAAIRQYPVLGVVKDNIDKTHSGRIRVYIAEFGGQDPDDSRYWTSVKYLSPWFGMISPGYDPERGPDGTGTSTGYGKYKGNPHSYGFWATAPDIGTTVVCIFINGIMDDGYYIGCVPSPGLHHMVPAVGSSGAVVPNSGESQSYGGADRLPVTEVNYANPTIRNSPKIYSEPKPIHSYQAGVLYKQGLIRDNFRGVISSSSQRETPSRVFGISTPGGPIYSGGYTSKEILQVAQTADNSKLQVVGRTGGHSIVLDDGTIDGQDQLIRIRTAGGHQIMMNDSGQNLTIIHSNGQSYIELGKEGTVDIYGTNSINLRSEGDVNLHADRDVNIHAKRNLTLFGDKIQQEADSGFTALSNKNMQLEAKGLFSAKSTISMSLETTGVQYLGASGVTFVKGKLLFLNTGQGVPALPVQPLTKTQHVDTVFDSAKGWINPSPNKLISMASRTPSHFPWAEAGKGVDVSTGQTAGGGAPSVSAGVTAAVTAATGVQPQPDAPTNLSTISTVPQGAGIVGGIVSGAPSMPAQVTGALISQQRNDVEALPDLLKAKEAIMGNLATPAMMAAPGETFKPGSSDFVRSLAQQVPLDALTGNGRNLTTGKYGVNTVSEAQNSTTATTSAFVNQTNTALVGLSRSGAINQDNTPTQYSGVVFAAANNGVKNVAAILQNPSTATSAFSQTSTGTTTSQYSLTSSPPPLGGPISATSVTQPLGITLLPPTIGRSVGGQPGVGSLANNLTSGNYAGQLADKFLGGNSGVVSGLSSLVAGSGGGIGGAINGAIGNILGGAGNRILGALGPVGGVIGGISSGLSKLFGGGGLKSLFGGGSQSAAFGASSASYGSLNANQPNYLGGQQPQTIARSAADQLADAQAAASSALDYAQRDVDSRSKNYAQNPSAENKQLLQEAQARLARAEAQSSRAQTQALTGSSASNGLINYGVPGQPTTFNSGLNAIPGGINSFYNIVNSGAANAFGSTIGVAKSLLGGNLNNVLGGTLGGKLTAGFPNIGNPSSLVGNLVGNTNTAITQGVAGVAANIAKGFGGATGGITNTLGSFGNLGSSLGGITTNLTGPINNLTGSLGSFSGSLGGLTSSLTGSLGGIGGSLGGLSGSLGSVGSSLSGLTGSLGGLTGSLGGLTGSLGGLSSLGGSLGSLSSLGGGLLGGFASGLGGLFGKGGGGVKQASLATNTFKAAPAVNSSLATVIGDPGVPTPTFEEVPVRPLPDFSQQQQSETQGQINSLNTELTEVQTKINLLTSDPEFGTGQNAGLMEQYSELVNEQSRLESAIRAEQTRLSDVVATRG